MKPRTLRSLLPIINYKNATIIQVYSIITELPSNTLSASTLQVAAEPAPSLRAPLGWLLSVASGAALDGVEVGVEVSVWLCVLVIEKRVGSAEPLSALLVALALELLVALALALPDADADAGVASRYAGGLTKSALLTSTPSPHGTLSPFGCRWCSAGSVFPSLSAMVKRVVHERRVVLEGVENW